MADNVTTQTATLATIPTSTVIETRDQGSGVERQVVQVQTVVRVSANFTRPADTTAYAANDLVANNTTAASVVPMSFALGNASAVTAAKSTFRILRAKIKKSTTVVTLANFNLFLFATDPSASSGIIAGDNAAPPLFNDAGYLGSILVSMTSPATNPLNDCTIGFGIFSSPGIAVTSANATVYGLLTANSAYVPGSAEVFTVTLEAVQD